MIPVHVVIPALALLIGVAIGMFGGAIIIWMHSIQVRIDQ